jgi:hypothetical protein
LPVLLPTALLLPAFSSSPTAPQGEREHLLKAQFIIELAGFLTFPRVKTPATPFTIVVVGESPFTDELEAYAKGRSIHGRPIQIRYMPRVPEGQACDLIFICRSEAHRAKAIVLWCHAKGILTVAEGAQLAVQGVMVNLLVEGNHLRLGLNQRALEEEGFIIGSQVLKVARVLVPSKPRP